MEKLREAVRRWRAESARRDVAASDLENEDPPSATWNQGVSAGMDECADELESILAAQPQKGEAPAWRWLEDLREQMAHCVSAADEGVDYAVSRGTLDAMTTLGLMGKVGLGKWAPTDAGRDFANAKPTLPVDIYGKLYEVPIPVQLHIVNLREKLTATPTAAADAEDAARYRFIRNAENMAEGIVAIYGGDDLDREIDAARNQEGGRE